MSIVHDLLGRLERQAERIGALEAELAQAQAQLLALPPAPEPPQSRRAWWRFWR